MKYNLSMSKENPKKSYETQSSPSGKTILFLCDDYGYHAGWSRVAKNLFTGSNKILEEGIAFFSSGKLKDRPPLIHDDILFSKSSSLFFIFIIYDFLRVLWRIRNQKIKVIHCLVEPYIPLAHFLSIFLRVKLVITIHGTYSIIPNSSVLKNIYFKSFRKAHAISSISEFTANRFRETWGDFKNLEVVYLGADHKIFRPNFKLSKEKYFIFVGTIKERKGLLPTLQAFEKILKDFPNYKFILITEKGMGASSTGKYFNSVMEICERNKQNIIFRGKVSEEELVKLYQKASANVLISLSNDQVFEGFGLIHVEANLCGCLTIGGVNSPNEEIIKNAFNGYLADASNMDSIANAFRCIIDKLEGSSSKNISNDCRTAGERFSWDSFIDWSLKQYF